MCKIPSVQTLHGGDEAEQKPQGDSSLMSAATESPKKVEKKVRFHEKLEPGAPFPSDVSF